MTGGVSAEDRTIAAVDPPNGMPEPPDGGGAGCRNCGSRFVRRYCPDCGQRAPTQDDYSISAHAADLIEKVASWDGKLPRTLWRLVAAPGALTVDHLEGRRGRYVGPIQLFLLVNLLLFVLAPRVPFFSYSLEQYVTHRPPSPQLVASLLRRAAPPPDTGAGGAAGRVERPRAGALVDRAYADAFDRRVEAQRKSLIILFAPALALVLRLVFRRRGTTRAAPARYGEHLVFALHLLVVMWLALAVGYGFATLVSRAAGAVAAIAFFLAVLLVVPVHAVRAVRRVYGLGWRRSVAVSLVLGAGLFALLLAYRALLFFTTYYTL